MSNGSFNNDSYVPERIRNMRLLNKNQRYPASDACLFYTQGSFMSAFTDDYGKYVPLSDSQPTYESMSDNQLRCYFTWRASARGRRAAGAGVYYLYLYFFELINNIGVTGGMDALERMAFIMAAYKDTFPESVPLFKIWFRDYYAMNDIAEPFEGVVRSLELTEFFPAESYERAFKYARILRVCGIELDNGPLIEVFGLYGFLRCFESVMENLNMLLKMYGINMDGVYNGAFVSDNAWFPYERAVYYGSAAAADRTARIGGTEQYICVRGVWDRKVLTFDAAAKSFAEMVVGRISAAVNPQTGRSERMRPDLRDTPFMAVINDTYFDEIINLTVTGCLSAPSSGSPAPISLDFYGQSGSDAVKAIWLARSVAAASNSDVEIARQFVSQARILADCEDDYESVCPLPAAPAPRYTYSMLSIPQTRLYLTWRAKYKRGARPHTEPVFANIYANELINKIGAGTDMDALEKLAALMPFDTGISETFLDYYITRADVMPFADLIQRLGVTKYFPNIAIQIKDYGDWHALFSDRLEFKPDAETAAAFNYCIGGLREYFEAAGLTFMVLFLGMDSDRRNSWRAFSRAAYLAGEQDNQRPNTTVSVSEYDTYAYSAAYHKWTCASASAINEKSIYLIEYIMKRLSARLKGQKAPAVLIRKVKNIFPPSPAYARYIQAVLSEDFNNAIDAAYSRFTQLAPKQPIIRVDASLLDSARKAADENLEKLLADYGDADERAPETALPAAETGVGWDAFLSALSDARRRALFAVSAGKTDELRGLARGENMLTEALIESINTAALDYTGDYIIEETGEGPKIFEEYAEALKGAYVVYG